MSTARGSWVGVAVFLANAALLLGGLGGINIPLLSRLAPLPSAVSPDYSRIPTGFAPLRDAFVSDTLGIDLLARNRAGSRGPVGTGTEPGGPEASGHPIGTERSDDPGSPKPPGDPGGPHPLTNDDFDGAYEVSSVPFDASTDSEPATRQEGEPGSCAPVGTTVWYRYRSPVTIGLSADTFGSTYALALGIFSGTSLDALQPVGCSHDPQGAAQVGFQAEAGTTYQFQVTAPVRGDRLTFHLGFQAVTTRASIGPAGQQLNQDATEMWMSANGRFVSFSTGTTGWGYDGIEGPPELGASVDDMVLLYQYGSCNRQIARTRGFSCQQVYVRDRLTHETEIASLTSAGVPIRENDANAGDVSNDGCIVGFYTVAANVAPGGPTGFHERLESYNQVYVRDRCRGTTELVSIGADGRYADDHALYAMVSADGRYVSFWSAATNLVAGGIDDDGDGDVFRRDLWTGRTEQVSVATSGAQQEPGQAGTTLDPFSTTFSAQSWSGRYVVFRSTAPNLDEERPDTNGKMDVFLRDMVKNTTIRVSVSSEEEEGDGDSLPTVNGVGQAVSDDGRYVLFLSEASNLVEGDDNEIEDLFLRDTLLGITTRVSVSSEGEEAEPAPPAEDPNALLGNPFYVLAATRPSGVGYSLSSDGRFAVFSSSSSNLAPGDTNGVHDVFLRDLERGTTTRVSLTRAGGQSDVWSSYPRISGDGRFIAFGSLGEAFTEGDSNGVVDAFVRELPDRRGALSGWG